MDTNIMALEFWKMERIAFSFRAWQEVRPEIKEQARGEKINRCPSPFIRKLSYQRSLKYRQEAIENASRADLMLAALPFDRKGESKIRIAIFDTFFGR